MNKKENLINMANIYIIENIKLGRQGLQTKDESGNWVDMHCQQGRLDGACVVYSIFWYSLLDFIGHLVEIISISYKTLLLK